MNRQSLARAIFMALAVVVAWLSLRPDPVENEAGFELLNWIAAVLFGSEAMGDKVAHFGAYAALGATARPAHLLTGARAPLAILALALYGAVLELGQGVGGIRDPDLLDALANTLGAACGYGLSLGASRLIRRIASA
jgi:VanZ family protein